MIEKPARLNHLATDQRGFVVPWFVQWFKDGDGCAYGDGEPEFRCADERKFHRALKEKRCWVCGDRLGVHLAFVIGPMCAVNKVTSEPPCHFECAEYAVRVCPFLSRPRMRRNEKDLPEEYIVEAPGVHLKRNPGVACIWVTRSYQTFRPHIGQDGLLINLGPADRVRWYCEGRDATRAEVDASLATGLPALIEVAKKQGGDAPAALYADMASVRPLLPAVGGMGG